MAATTTSTTISVEIPKNLKRDLTALANRTGRTEAEIIVEAVERHLQSERRPRPRSWGMVSDTEVTGENFEDWLAENWKPDWE